MEGWYIVRGKETSWDRFVARMATSAKVLLSLAALIYILLH